MTKLHRLEKGATICGFPVSALRAEARKGRLELIKVANRHYVSDEAIEDMIRKCAERKDPGLTSNPVPGGSPSGASVTERRKSALVYLKANGRKPRSASPST